LSTIQVSTKEIFADCILCLQANKDIYEISLRQLADRNDRTLALVGGEVGSGAQRPIPPPHQHRDACHFD
jgi:hypothetical protein